MTNECLFAKLSFLIGKGYSTDRIKTLMATSLRGELTNSAKIEQRYELANSDMVLAVADYLNVKDHEDIKKIDHCITPVFMNSIAQSGNVKLFKKMHKEGADLDAIDQNGLAVLHILSNMDETKEHVEIMEYIVHCQVNLDLLDNKARSALYLAIEQKNHKMANILVKAGASIVADEGRIAQLLCTTGYRNDHQKLKYLVQCEVDLEISDYDKRTIGHLAAAEGHIEMLEYLIENTRFNFHLKDRFGTKVIDEIRSATYKKRIT